MGCLIFTANFTVLEFGGTEKNSDLFLGTEKNELSLTQESLVAALSLRNLPSAASADLITMCD